MRVDHAIHVGTRPQDFRMDVDLAVPARRTGDDLALEIDGQDVDHGDLVEAHAVRLHEKQFWLAGHPHRDVAASEIVVALGDHPGQGEQGGHGTDCDRPAHRAGTPAGDACGAGYGQRSPAIAARLLVGGAPLDPQRCHW